MPKISDARRQERRDQIARAAVSEFVTNGIHSTSMANIMSSSGLSAGAIYTHFASKDEIVAYVAISAVESVLRGVERLQHDPPARPSELFSTLVGALTQAALPAQLIVQVWGEAVVNVAVRQLSSDVYMRVQERLSDHIQEWARRSGGDEVDAAELASARSRVVVGLIYAHILRASLLDDYDWHSAVADAAPVLDAL